MIDDLMLRHISRVRAAYPNARLETSGLMYWVEDNGRMLSERKTTPKRAWASASDFVQSGG